MNIAVAGTSYVGLSIATLLVQHNYIIAVAGKFTIGMSSRNMDWMK